MMCSSLFLRLVKIPLVLLQWMSPSQMCNVSMFLHQLSFDWMGIVVWSVVEPKRIPQSKHRAERTVMQLCSICLIVDMWTHTFRCHMVWLHPLPYIAVGLDVARRFKQYWSVNPKQGLLGLRWRMCALMRFLHVVWRLADLLLSIWLVSDVSL